MNVKDLKKLLEEAKQNNIYSDDKNIESALLMALAEFIINKYELRECYFDEIERQKGYVSFIYKPPEQAKICGDKTNDD